MEKELMVDDSALGTLIDLIDKLHLEEEFVGSNAKLKFREFNSKFNEALPTKPIERFRMLVKMHLLNAVQFYLDEENHNRDLMIQLHPEPVDHQSLSHFIAGIPTFTRLSKVLGVENNFPDTLLEYFYDFHSNSPLQRELDQVEDVEDFEKFIFLYCCGRLLYFNIRKTNMTKFSPHLNPINYLKLFYKLTQQKSGLTKGKFFNTWKDRGELDLVLELTTKTINLLIPDLEQSKANEVDSSPETFNGFTLYPSASLEAKPLFFNETNLKFKDRIITILKNQTKESLNNYSISLMISGYPGTGKTEFAKQLCKEMGYSLMFVEASEIQTKWIGETEQNLHALFEKYKTQSETSDVPIVLLFNECDQLFNKKIAVERSTDVFSNSIQSQLLNEMEKFKGILICTCNSTQNLEEAFKRRFLFHSIFEEPDQSVRKQIWQSTNGFWQSDEFLMNKLAELEITGAEIQNVVMKFNLITSVDELYVNHINLLEELIEELLISKSFKSKIGF